MGIIAKALKKSKADLAGPASDEEIPEFKLGDLLDSLKPSVGQTDSAGGITDLAKERPLSGEPPPQEAKPPAPAASGLAVGRGLSPPSKKAPSAGIESKGRETLPPVAEAAEDSSSCQVLYDVGDAARKKIDPSLVSLLDPDGMEAELFRLLRTRILFPPSGQPPRTILITSALAEEGKSFVAANLAINMARNIDQHVLLVDCDLRKPSMHSRFGFNGFKGLSEYLSDGQEIPSLLLKTGVEKLTLLPSGASPPNPSELVTSSKMAALIKELKARYDDRYIIIDSPPPMMTPETSAIAKWVDGILLVVKYGTTPMDLVEELVNQLDREKIIGAVINKFNLREFRRYSYKKYYRYGKYHPA
jgi:exopolysaccharide/PEP-CTERM locus tyrosine autokinase